jgi:DNA-binding beta-propeller fold protein YncE
MLLCSSLVLALVAIMGPGAAAAEPKVTALISGLDNPCGVAIQPNTGVLFVSDSAAGRVIRYNPNSASKATPVITDFGQDIYGKGPMYNIGPLGLGFLNQQTLVVGGGERVDGQEILSIFSLPAEGRSIPADKAKYKLGPLGPSEETKMGEGNFYGIAVSPSAIYITSNGDDTKGWILKVDVNDNTPGELRPFIATKVALEDTDAPVGITLANDGSLVVGQMGEVNLPGDSLLTVYDKSGKLLLRARTGLHDIAGLAYSPSGKLYAVDFAWVDPSQGGLFRLDVTKEGDSATCKATKIASLDKPTAMAFGADGSLYVTVFGTAKENSRTKPGQLLKITGDL